MDNQNQPNTAPNNVQDQYTHFNPEEKQNTLILKNITDKVTEADLLALFPQKLKSAVISAPKREFQQKEGQIIFQDHLDLVNFIYAHKSLSLDIKGDLVDIKLPKHERATLVVNRISQKATSAIFQETVLEYLKTKLNREIGVVATLFETKSSGKAANIQFAREKDMEAAYKFLLQDEFTEELSKKMNLNAKLVSIEETSRRYEFKETVVNEGEILKMPVSRYDPSKRGDRGFSGNGNERGFSGNDRGDRGGFNGGDRFNGNERYGSGERYGNNDRGDRGFNNRDYQNNNYNNFPRQQPFRQGPPPPQGQNGNFPPQGENPYQNKPNYRQGDRGYENGGRSYENGQQQPPRSGQPPSSYGAQTTGIDYFQPRQQPPQQQYGQQTTNQYGQPSEYQQPPANQSRGNFNSRENTYQNNNFENRPQTISTVSVYVENIPMNAEERDISMVFQRFKIPDRVNILPQKNDYSQDKTAIIYFNDEQIVKSVLSSQDQIQIQGQTLRVKKHFRK